MGPSVVCFSFALEVVGRRVRHGGCGRYSFERIDGNVHGNRRQAAIDRFSAPGSQGFVFLLCTKAGGVGINLTAADTVIIFDSDWNPQNDLQAMARCHRIGQQKQVKVYRLITRKTYEMHMFHAASLKLGLDRAVMGGMTQDASGPAALKLDEVRPGRDVVLCCAPF